jgi:hypothetical protein
LSRLFWLYKKCSRAKAVRETLSVLLFQVARRDPESGFAKLQANGMPKKYANWRVRGLIRQHIPMSSVLQGSALYKPVPDRGLALGRGLGKNTASRPVNCPDNRHNTAFYTPSPAQIAGPHCRFRPMRQKNACFPVAV